MRCACALKMKALAYLQIVGLVNSFVIRDNDRGKRDTDPDRNLCKEVNSTIYPVVGQTREGELKHIEQRRDGENNFQPVSNFCIYNIGYNVH